MQVLIDIFWLQISKMFFQISQASLSCIDAFEKRVVYMFLFFYELLLFDKSWCDVLEKGSIEVFIKIISMKEWHVSVMPKELKSA
jgi:hypothetical protein